MSKTYDTIIEILKAEIVREQEGIDLFERFKKATEKFEGKKITKAIATAFEKELGPEYVVYYSSEYGMYQISFWKGSSQNKKQFLIGYDSTPIFRRGHSTESHSGIEYFCNCYGQAAKERNDRRRETLRNQKTLDKMASAIDKLLEAREELEQFSDYSHPGWYAIVKALKVES